MTKSHEKIIYPFPQLLSWYGHGQEYNYNLSHYIESFNCEILPAAETFPAPSLSINFPRNFPTALNLNTKKALTSPGSS